jgi:glycogen debranching enzyme
MREATLQQLKGCRVLGYDGTWLHTPDGIGNYKALWTRDTYYMVEYAGDLMDRQEIKASIEYLLGGQRDDGCMPDRVDAAGKAVYSPGGVNNPMADHALDNGPFMAMLVCSYVNQHDDEELFCHTEPMLKLGLDHTNVNQNGLVYNDPKNPQCVYGFTDVVKKTGDLLFCSLLYYKANMEMHALCRKYKCGSEDIYKRRFEYVHESINKLWNEDLGMFMAADKDCRQVDIWGSAYAIEVGIASKEQSSRITDYLVQNIEAIAMHGQVRHLAGGDSGWNNLFIDIKEGTYQNGAYWATPLAWVIPAIAKRDKELAKKMLDAVIKDFQANGINECINEGYVKVPNYVVSATNVYALTR